MLIINKKRLKLEKDIKYQNEKLLQALQEAGDEKKHKDTLLQIELDKKDKELAELKKQLNYTTQGNNLTDSINENYIMNSQDENGLYDIDLNSNYECDSAVHMVGKKLENMYLELNTRNEMMDKLSSKYNKLEKLYKMEQSKKNPKTLWQKISSLF